MGAEDLIAQAERAAYHEDYRNFRVRLETETFLAVHGLLKVDKILEETDLHNRQLSLGEGLFTMLADRFRDAMRKAEDHGTETIEVDLSYRELNTLGDVAVVKGNAALAPYVLNLNGAFVAAGGRDNQRLRAYFEMLTGI
ncbi:MAG: hypothetical protein AAB512_00710 [Patescibacteria group bacterium]